MNRLFSACGRFVSLISTVAATSASAQTNDLVGFFKRAISSPPDVERFIVSQRSFSSGSTSYYAGAIAGSNYFLQMLSGPNAVPTLNNRRLVAGRSAAATYEVGLNNVSYGVGSNGLAGGVEILFSLTRQLLHMGLSEIEPGSVRWSGNSFTAKASNGYNRYGKLSTSNGLPFRLEISAEKGLSPYKMVQYTYPNPPSTLNGFPRRFTMFGGSSSKLIPVAEVIFYSVQLSPRPLSDDFFTAARFIGTNIVHTNIYSNADIYVATSKGRIVKLPDSVKKNGGYFNSRARPVVLLCFVLISVVPITFFILQLKNKQNKKGIV